MAIKVMIQDGIVSDLFEVVFEDKYLNGLTQYIEREPTFKWVDGEMIQSGSRFVMKHKDLLKIINEMAYD